MMKPYIVCTGKHGRCVLFGYANEEPQNGKPIRLERARMVLCWSRECGGLLGLAANGPKCGTHITSEVKVAGTQPVADWIFVEQPAAEEISKWPAA